MICQQPFFKSPERVLSQNEFELSQRCHDHQFCISAPAGKRRKPVDGVIVGPMNILDEDDHRLILRKNFASFEELAQHAFGCCSGNFPGDSLVAVLLHFGRKLREPGWGMLRHQIHHRLPPRHSQEHRESFQHRVVGFASAETLHTLPAQDHTIRRSAEYIRLKGVQERCLSNSDFAGYEDQLRYSFANLLKCFVQRIQCRAATDESWR